MVKFPDQLGRTLSVAKLSSSWKRFASWRSAALLLVFLLLAGLAMTAKDEVETSRRQAAWLSRLAPELRYETAPGPSPAIRFPGVGPFDERLGYHDLPALVKRLGDQGFGVVA